MDYLQLFLLLFIREEGYAEGEAKHSRIEFPDQTDAGGYEEEFFGSHLILHSGLILGNQLLMDVPLEFGPLGSQLTQLLECSEVLKVVSDLGKVCEGMLLVELGCPLEHSFEGGFLGSIELSFESKRATVNGHDYLVERMRLYRFQVSKCASFIVELKHDLVSLISEVG